MDKAKISAALENLKTVDKSRSDTAKIRDVIDVIESAIENGVSREAIYLELQKEGLSLTFDSFKNSLYRIRQKLKSPSGNYKNNVTREAVITQPKTESTDTTLVNKKAEREKVANRFIDASTTNPLVKRLFNKDKKQ